MTGPRVFSSVTSAAAWFAGRSGRGASTRGPATSSRRTTALLSTCKAICGPTRTTTGTWRPTSPAPTRGLFDTNRSGRGFAHRPFQLRPHGGRLPELLQFAGRAATICPGRLAQLSEAAVRDHRHQDVKGEGIAHEIPLVQACHQMDVVSE